MQLSGGKPSGEPNRLYPNVINELYYDKRGYGGEGIVRIVIAGGTGFIGRALCTRLIGSGHEVTVLTRDTKRARAVLPQQVRLEEWEPRQPKSLVSMLSRSDSVVNLAGESIAAQRWTPQFKERLLTSRVDTTRTLVEAMRLTETPPTVLLNASAVGIYGDRGDEELTEESEPGTGFLAELGKQWEQAADAALDLGVRVTKMRIGIVLGEGGGALEKMLLPFRWYVGGPYGNGQQWFPWIHLEDVCGLFAYVLENETIHGAVNVVAPGVVRIETFCKELGKVMVRPSWLPVPAFALRMVLGSEMASALLLASQRVIPQVALQCGYAFRYATVGEALRAVLK